LSAESLAGRLRTQARPVVTRVEEGRVLIDMRTVFEDEDEEVVRALLEIG
jgi:seryl-tRNA(Sec) selenium transferase